MNAVLELRDADAVRRFAAESWNRRCVITPDSPVELRRQVWELVRALLDEGSPVPPLGFVADVWLLLELPRSGLPTLLDSPSTFLEERIIAPLISASDWPRIVFAWQTTPATERGHLFTFLMGRLVERLGQRGFQFNPDSRLERQPEHTETSQAPATIQETDPVLAAIDRWYELTAARLSELGQLWSEDDHFEIEHRMASASWSDRFALRQILQVARRLSASLSSQKPPRLPGLGRIATRYSALDAYPIGGYETLSNRGSLESLLHSQLALMETDPAARPDLFDIRSLRDELLYYARDEGQLLRPHIRFVWVLETGLDTCQQKDPGLPCQRIMILWGLLLTLERQLREWLQETSLTCEIVWLEQNEFSRDSERLLRYLFRDRLEAGQVIMSSIPLAEWPQELARRQQRELCLGVHWTGRPLSHSQDNPASQHQQPTVWPQVSFAATVPQSSQPASAAISANSADSPQTDSPWAPWEDLLQQHIHWWWQPAG